MKGDFSRIRFSPEKQYTAVIEQQGRVALDADANEQIAINEYLSRAETVDVIGEYGAPANDAGFAISVNNGEIFIGTGRYYVEGLMCENTNSNLTLSTQPFLIDPNLDEAGLLQELQRYKGEASIRVYLQVWQRLVTALDDPCLREPALGQADTTARLQTVWRVVASLVAPANLKPGPIRQPIPGERLNRTNPVLSSVAAHPVAGIGTHPITSPVSVSTGVSGTSGTAPLPIHLLTCCEQMYLDATELSTGKLSAQTSGTSDTCGCQPIPAAGYRGLENQLYRVEIHTGGDETTATFKWSRENGSVVSAVLGVSGATVQVDSLGPDANLGFQANQWVEIYDDTFLFGPTPNQPGNLYQIQSIDPASNSITMYTTVAAVETWRNARIRRWDQTGASATSNGIPLSAGTWLDLENGIQISFAAGTYQSGNYWTIPARTASGQIDWPPCGSDGSPWQLAKSVRVYSAPLACIHWDIKKEAFYVEDCRRLFSPLTDLTAPVTPQAMHVTQISWTNDDIITLDQLVASGLTVTLDGNPSGPVNSANFVVDFEIAAPPPNTDSAKEFAAIFQRAIFEGAPSTILRGLTITDSLITVNNGAILWQLPYLEAGYEQRITILYLNALLSYGARAGWFARARVRLLGRTIFSGSGGNQIFLDGQSYGQAALRADGTTPRIDLQLPSGNDEKASDFESWFYVAPTLVLSSLTVNYPALTVVINANNQVTGVTAPNAAGAPQPVVPQATLTVNYPAIADTTVSLALTGTSGVGTIASVPSTVTINRNTTSVSIPISVLGNPGANTTYTFQITASITSAVGLTSQLTASFTVTGVPPNIIIQ
ncbi:MAG TPA: DUF6519 domain-containing protein [Pseudacidobacterium sp.]|nr:DUF6519 domain-containing protein [Pseudacidobacterium sp.]